MKIIVDENIPYGKEAFGTLGDVQTAHGRKITPDMLQGADALIVRSITKVNEALLADTLVRFVGTCTIGEDHIDKAYLAANNIAFTSAPGCNANSVGEYIIAALLVLAERYGLRLDEMSLGIVGAGNVGSKVYKKATALSMTCVLNDPPLADATGDPIYRPVDEILECDVVTLHTPLERGGKYPTWHLGDKEFIRWLKPSAILINSSRGAVVDNFALEEALRTEDIRAAVLDVWENEPTPNTELLRLTDIATPHIAGYSFDGKVNGTTQVYEALCAFLGGEPTWTPQEVLPPPPVPELLVNPDEADPLTGAVLSVYDIMTDDMGMREILELPRENHAAHFDGLRKNYPVRREFFNTTVRLSRPDETLAQRLAGIGFSVAE
ncbi:MAG TPA: 4-phosphoerythronate dehydrogenase [Candidatus Hydrogenedentes bacterium]|mgnify:CR=1 FL=1|nr:4-phosphoerythronate dehydrogenase [Candidatus Hydrogenedentota bacterium]